MYIHLYIYIYIYIIKVYIHIHTYIHTYMHTYIHTYIHIYISYIHQDLDLGRLCCGLSRALGFQNVPKEVFSLGFGFRALGFRLRVWALGV